LSREGWEVLGGIVGFLASFIAIAYVAALCPSVGERADSPFLRRRGRSPGPTHCRNQVAVAARRAHAMMRIALKLPSVMISNLRIV